MTYVQWTYSAVKVFKTCPLQYKHKYILKDIKEVQGDAAKYGTAVHLAIENWARDGVVMPPEYDRFRNMILPVAKWQGETLVEAKLALSSLLQPCGFFDKQYFVRGVLDFGKVNGEYARIIDWKTGGNAKYADLKQLDLMSLLVFKHYPQVKTVTSALVFLKLDKVIKATFHKKDSKAMWMQWMYEVSRIEDAVERDAFPAAPNNLCKNYCPVKTCKFNGV